MIEEAVIEEAVIDTNILYYWAGISTMGNGFPFGKIEEYSAKNTKNKIYVSEISMLELFVHYQKNPGKICQCIKHMQDQNISVLYVDSKTILDTKKRYSSFQDAVQREDNRVQDSFIVGHRKVKAHIEAEYLRFFLYLQAEVLFGVLEEEGGYKKTLSDGSKNILLQGFIHPTIAELSKSATVGCFEQLLNDAYSNGKNTEKVIQESFSKVLYDQLLQRIEIYYGTYSKPGDIEKDMANDPYIQQVKVFRSQTPIKSPFTLLKGGKATKKLAKEIKDQVSMELDKNVNITREQRIHLLQRLGRYLEKTGNDGKKMAKNDISDMLILPVIKCGRLVLTTDGQFARDLEEIHEPSYKTIIELELYKEKNKEERF